MIIEQRSGQRLERWDVDTHKYESWWADELKEARDFTDAELAFLLRTQLDADWQARRAEAGRLLRLAFATNAAYLQRVEGGLAILTDHTAQIARLTRQMQGMMRLVVATSAQEDVGFESPVVTGGSQPIIVITGGL